MLPSISGRQTTLNISYIPVLIAEFYGTFSRWNLSELYTYTKSPVHLSLSYETKFRLYTPTLVPEWEMSLLVSVAIRHPVMSSLLFSVILRQFPQKIHQIIDMRTPETLLARKKQLNEKGNLTEKSSSRDIRSKLIKS